MSKINKISKIDKLFKDNLIDFIRVGIDTDNELADLSSLNDFEDDLNIINFDNNIVNFGLFSSIEYIDMFEDDLDTILHLIECYLVSEEKTNKRIKN